MTQKPPHTVINQIEWNKDDAFSGIYFFLSNFYERSVQYNGFVYPTSEHAFAAQKTLDHYQRKIIATAKSPGEAKALGRRCTLRTNWEEIKDGVMLRVVRDKFTRYEDLGQRLLDTGYAELIEWNSWNDTYWGKVVLKGDILGQPKEFGKNQLGRILMRVRTELREKTQNAPNKD